MEKTPENFDLEYDEDGKKPVVTISLATDRHDAISRNPRSRRAAQNKIGERQGLLQNFHDDPDLLQEQTTMQDIRPARRGHCTTGVRSGDGNGERRKSSHRPGNV